MICGRDCTITLKTQYREIAVPYSEETIREAYSVLTENAAIEGDGVCSCIRKSAGVSGCVVTPLTIGTAPLLLALALGEAGVPAFVSSTKNVFRHAVNLTPVQNGNAFDLIQCRGSERLLFEQCRVKSFELRIARGEVLKLKLDVHGDYGAVVYPYQELPRLADEERFKESGVSYRINGDEYKNIYGLSISANKEDGTKTEIWIHRILESGVSLPDIIDTMVITAQLDRNKYEGNYFGLFRLSLSRLVLVSEETTVNSSDAVIGPERYYCAGVVSADVFTNTDGELA